jgi:glycerol-3-phosphate acyltransferase PlsX
VGLVNIGSEDKKGNEFAREVHALFKRSRANFVGNVEGNNIFRGTCDVVVTDGFVGNVLLKVAEGLGEFLFGVFQAELAGSGLRASADEILSRIHRRIDYSEYGGALLLGIEGICIICHGRSDAKAISNAIAVAVKAVTSKVTQHIVSDVRDLGSLEPA